MPRRRGIEVGLGDVCAVYQDAAGGGQDHAIDGAQESGLAGAAAAKQDGGGALFYGQRDRLQKAAALGRGERHIMKFDSSGQTESPCEDSVRG